MSLLSLLGISDGYAETAAPAHVASAQGSALSALPMLLLFIVAFYFLIVRPQSKRAKEQRQLMESLTVGDEVLTTGGIIGRLIKMRDNYVVIDLGKDIQMTFQKSAILNVLPKGTMAAVTE